MTDAHGTFRGWIPDVYLDEQVPACRARPDDWLARRGDHLVLAPWDADDPIDETATLVAEGEQIGFDGLTSFGTIRLRWHGPGRYTLLDPEPAGATCFWIIGDMETFASSLADFAQYNDFAPDEVVTVDCYDWSYATFVLRGGAFVRVEAGEAA